MSLKDMQCGCGGSADKEMLEQGRGVAYLGWIAAGLVVWVLVYRQLDALASWLSFSLLGLDPASHLGEAARYFLYDTPKVLMLLVLVIFFVGILRSFFSPERSRALLAGRREFLGNGLAAGLGVLTPFCSCSAVPLFLGFVTAGVPLGVTFSFLIAAPMVNEVALVLLYGLLGFKVAALYAGLGLLVAIIAGMILGRLKLESWLAPWVQELQAQPVQLVERELRLEDRIMSGVRAVRDILSRIWIWIVIGVGVGAGIHGYVPEGALAEMMGRDAWWSVPAAVALGIPMYSSAAGMVPVVEALLGKGAALGTALAFMMSVVALSLPEMLILRRVLRVKLIATFAAVVGLGILLVGYVFNYLVL